MLFHQRDKLFVLDPRGEKGLCVVLRAMPTPDERDRQRLRYRQLVGKRVGFAPRVGRDAKRCHFCRLGHRRMLPRRPDRTLP